MSELWPSLLMLEGSVNFYKMFKNYLFKLNKFIWLSSYIIFFHPLSCTKEDDARVAESLPPTPCPWPHLYGILTSMTFVDIPLSALLSQVTCDRCQTFANRVITVILISSLHKRPEFVKTLRDCKRLPWVHLISCKDV